ncbi:MAG: hypothetical protein ABFR32_10820 [Bacteroidota bacterium]
MSKSAKSKKNIIILSILFFGPLIFYLLLLTGTHKFNRLPILTQNIEEINHLSDENIQLKDHISILCFLGNDVLQHKTNALNLNEKIYKHFYGFKDFQFVVVMPEGTELAAEQLKKELGATTDVEKWHFLFGTKNEINNIFNSLQTNYKLNEKLYAPYAFIIDKDLNLRGRDNDEDIPNGILYGYNAETVATIHKKMVDDVKVVMAEYRLALKKNKRKI